MGQSIGRLIVQFAWRLCLPCNIDTPDLGIHGTTRAVIPMQQKGRRSAPFA